MTILPPGWYPDPDGSGMQRYFNGTEWGDYRHYLVGEILSTDHRAALLNNVLTQHLARHPNARLATHTPHAATVVYGRTPKPLVHPLLTASTCGLWLLGWIALAATRREYRVSFEVDPHGNVVRSS